MKTITKKTHQKKLEKVPNGYKIFMNYDVYINDPAGDLVIDHNLKRVTLL